MNLCVRVCHHGHTEGERKSVREESEQDLWRKSENVHVSESPSLGTDELVSLN